MSHSCVDSASLLCPIPAHLAAHIRSPAALGVGQGPAVRFAVASRVTPLWTFHQNVYFALSSFGSIHLKQILVYNFLFSHDSTTSHLLLISCQKIRIVPQPGRRCGLEVVVELGIRYAPSGWRLPNLRS